MYQIRRLEWSWACYAGTLNLDTRLNIMFCMSAFIHSTAYFLTMSHAVNVFWHIVMDIGHGFAFIPSLSIVEAVARDAKILRNNPDRKTADRIHFLVRFRLHQCPFLICRMFYLTTTLGLIASCPYPRSKFFLLYASSLMMVLRSCYSISFLDLKYAPISTHIP